MNNSNTVHNIHVLCFIYARTLAFGVCPEIIFRYGLNEHYIRVHIIDSRKLLTYRSICRHVIMFKIIASNFHRHPVKENALEGFADFMEKLTSKIFTVSNRVLQGAADHVIKHSVTL